MPYGLCIILGNNISVSVDSLFFNLHFKMPHGLCIVIGNNISVFLFPVKEKKKKKKRNYQLFKF